MSEEALLHDLLYYRVKDYEVQKRRDSGNFVVPFNVQNANHFLYAWNTLMGFPEKTDPDVFRTISHLDIEGLQDYRMSLINGSRRTLAGN